MEEKPPVLSANLLDEISVNLLNAGRSTVGQEWNFSNITSPFTRIYLITDGEGYILPNNTMIRLCPGKLYIIPSFVQCNYHCVDTMSQYYIHITTHFPTGLNIYDFYSIQSEVEAVAIDTLLFERLIEINPGMALEKSDPRTYEKNAWKQESISYRDSAAHLETTGIIRQILARFLGQANPQLANLHAFSSFRKVFQHIQANLDQEIRIEDLAEIACYSYDHFTRVFKKMTGTLPVKYINNKRIEKAQMLLLTTGWPQEEICERSGFNNLPYFYRVFKQKTGTTPVNYRKMGGLV